MNKDSKQQLFSKEIFNGVDATLLIPLSARNYVSKHFADYFYDQKAIELAAQLPRQEIVENSNQYYFLASISRYYYMDKIARRFITENPNCNIVDLGGGLETQYHRLGLPAINYYVVDLPHVIELREKILPATERECFIGGDIFNLEWTKQTDSKLPTLFLSSGVLIYFEEKQVINLLNGLTETFSNAQIVFDATNSKGLKFANRYVEKTGNKNAKMHFAIDDPNAFVKQLNGARLIEVLPFFKDALKQLKGRLSFKTKLYMWLADSLKRTIILHLV